MTSKLSQLLQNLLAAPNKDVADPEALTKQAQAAFNQGVVEAIENLPGSSAQDFRLKMLHGQIDSLLGRVLAIEEHAALSVPPLQTSAAIPPDPAPPEPEPAVETVTGYGGPDAPQAESEIAE